MSKVAVITGSSGGIGSALVRKYLDDGYFVTGLDRNSSENPVIGGYTEIEVSLLMFSKDPLCRERVLQKIKGSFPKTISKLVVINNAAEQILKSVPEIEWQDWENSFAVNTVAPFFLVQGLLQQLKVSRGHVINISSIHAKLTKPNFACYAASKSALEALTRSLALELSPKGISVNAVAPAAISTRMLHAGFEGAPAKLRELENFHPSKSIGTPEEVSVFIKNITDQEGGFLTGSVLEFNGGIAGRLYDPD
jgi:NAD(P)-dependent dehydrogenase (short-subunit alcohol dehydrogenase family)